MREVAPRLEIKGVSRTFGCREVVSDVSLLIMPGQLTCLLGPSGCGKSTTLRIIAGVDRQDTGTILIDGEIVSDRRIHIPPELRSVGFMFQEFALFPHLTVGQNVAFGIKGRRAEKRKRVDNLLGKMGMEGFKDSFPYELSGGEQQRVALARALAPKPRIMLMDEPFASLDERLRDRVRDEALEVLKGEQTAVLMVTHDPREAMRMSDEIAFMRQGRIIQQGAPFEIYNSPVDRDTAAFFSDLNMVHGVVRDACVETVFGKFPTPGLVDGADVEVIIRPQHVRIDFDRGGKGPLATSSDGVAARGVVHRSRYMGNTSLVEFRMEFDNSILVATVPSAFLPNPGAPLWLSFRRDRCLVYPCTVQARVDNPYKPGLEATGPVSGS